MGFFTPSYVKPGKGIDPDAPQKRSFFRFFDIFFRKFWKFVKINLLYVLVSIPTFALVFFLSGIISNSFLSMNGTEEMFRSIAEQIAQASENAGGADYQYSILVVTFDLFIRLIISYLFMTLWGMGPATAGITYILRNFAREEHAWLWSDFKSSFKNNFKQSLIVFVIDIVVFLLLYTAFVVYSQMTGALSMLKYFIVVIAIIYTIMHFYIYPMMVTFDLKLKDLYRNALIFALGKLPSNLFILVILLLIHVGSAFAAVVYGGNYAMLVLFVVLLLEILLLQSFSAFLINFNTYPKMKSYMFEKNDTSENISQDL